MTKDEFYDYLITKKGQKVDELIINANSQIQKQFIPEFFVGSDAQIIASDFIYWLLVDLVAKTDGILRSACHIPESLAHGGNIVCLACEEKCNNFVPF